MIFGNIDWLCKLALLKVNYWVTAPGFPFSVSILSGYFILLLLPTFLSPSTLFDNTDSNSATYQEGKKRKLFFHLQQRKSLWGQMFWHFSIFKSKHLKLIMLQDLVLNSTGSVFSSWVLKGINNIKTRLFSENASIHANN